MGVFTGVVVWFVVALVVVEHVRLVLAARGASGPGAPSTNAQTPRADRLRVLVRVFDALTGLLFLRAFGPWDVLPWPLWGVLAAMWVWGALVLASAWRRLPWRAVGGGRRRTSPAELVLSVGLLLVVVVFVVL